jgi:hypothetical protein
MTTTIDASGLAKIASGNLLRDLINERARVQRWLDKAQAKFAGIKALEEELRPYLQPGDYEHLYERLQHEIERWNQREKELTRLVQDERHRPTREWVARHEASKREKMREEIREEMREEMRKEKETDA